MNNENYCAPNRESLPELELDQAIDLAFSRDIARNLLRNDLEINELENIIFIARTFEITTEQALVFTAITHKCKTKSHLKEHELIQLLIAFLSSKKTRLSVRELTDKGFIDVNHSDGNRLIYLKEEIQAAIDNSDIEKFTKRGPICILSSISFFKKECLDYDHISIFKIDKTISTLSKLDNLNLVKYLEAKLYYFTHDCFTLLSIISKNFEDSEPFELGYIKRWTSVSVTDFQILKASIINKNWKPIADGYVELETSNLLDPNDIKLNLTIKGIAFFMNEAPAELLENLTKQKKSTNLNIINYHDINQIEMKFNDNFKEEINILEELLKPKNFKKWKAKFNRSCNVLLSGKSGTGKTTFVKNLSKITKRNLVVVKSSEIQDPYIGVSLQKLQSCFDSYAKLCKIDNSILLIDEADSLLGSRVNVTSASDRLQNELTNLFLQLIEQHDGCVFVITNNPTSLDNAFARRFSFDFSFPTPNKETQRSYWNKSLPELQSIDIDKIVNRYNFTIAEIEQLTTRYLTKTMFQNFKSNNIIGDLLKFCETEYGYTSNQIIGFNK